MEGGGGRQPELRYHATQDLLVGSPRPLGGDTKCGPVGTYLLLIRERDIEMIIRLGKTAERSSKRCTPNDHYSDLTWSYLIVNENPKGSVCQRVLFVK